MQSPGANFFRSERPCGLRNQRLRGTKFFPPFHIYIPCNTLSGALFRYVKKFSYLYVAKQLADILEGVFAPSLSENVEVFNNNGTTNGTHLLVSIWQGAFLASTPYLSGVGYCIVYCCYWSFHNHLADRRIRLHTFFLYLPRNTMERKQGRVPKIPSQSRRNT